MDPPKKSFFLLGPRLTGKSTWLHQHFTKNNLMIDLLENSQYQHYLLDPERLTLELEAFQKQHPNGWVIIDEVQKVPQLLNVVQQFMLNSKLKFALSGSSARKLKRSGANLLAGRAIDHRFFPLIHSEFQESWTHDEAIHWGSLPPVFLAASLKERQQILRSYVSLYLREEVQTEALVRNLSSFAQFLKFSAESVGQELNFTSLSKEIGVVSKTVKEYYQVLEDTLIGYFVHPWQRTIRKQLAGHPKFYFFDNGVTQALREQLSSPLSLSISGFLMEQYLINEVRALMSYLEYEGSLYFWKARGGNEVDLIIAQGSNPKLAIEIKFTNKPNKNHLSGLKSFQEDHPKVSCILVTRQPRDMILDGFETYSISSFLKFFKNGKWL